MINKAFILLLPQKCSNFEFVRKKYVKIIIRCYFLWKQLFLKDIGLVYHSEKFEPLHLCVKIMKESI